MSSRIVVAADDPGARDVRELLQQHLAFCRSCTPDEFVFALDVDALTGPDVAFFSARTDGGELLGVGALKRLDDDHGELKSMHTAAAARGRGVGALIVEHALDEARRRGYCRISFETGAQGEFAPARALYRRLGFEECGRFGDYPDSGASTFMTQLTAGS